MPDGFLMSSGGIRRNYARSIIYYASLAALADVRIAMDWNWK